MSTLLAPEIHAALVEFLMTDWTGEYRLINLGEDDADDEAGVLVEIEKGTVRLSTPYDSEESSVNDFCRDYLKSKGAGDTTAARPPTTRFQE